MLFGKKKAKQEAVLQNEVKEDNNIEKVEAVEAQAGIMAEGPLPKNDKKPQPNPGEFTYDDVEVNDWLDVGEQGWGRLILKQPNIFWIQPMYGEIFGVTSYSKIVHKIQKDELIYKEDVERSRRKGLIVKKAKDVEQKK